jgi:hypothetical protein
MNTFEQQNCLEWVEIIDWLPFLALETVMFLKNTRRRPKDLVDLELIEKYLSEWWK